MPEAAPDCADELRKIYDAVMALSGGERVATISFGGRSVTYQQHQLKEIKALGRMFYRECGANSGLVNIFDDGRRAERGRPINVRSWT